jgi:hypothetical protein
VFEQWPFLKREGRKLILESPVIEWGKFETIVEANTKTHKGRKKPKGDCRARQGLG